MKKILAFLCVVMVSACATTVLDYDRSVLTIGPKVKLNYINSTSHLREKDGHMLVQVQGVSSANQTVYYKVDWFNSYGGKIKTVLSKWQQKKLLKDIDFTIDVTSPSPKVTGYKVIITTDIGDGILN